MLYLYPSNKTEALATVMAEIMRGQPLSDPFKSEVILTQSHGMGVWLEQQMSEKLGIAAMMDVMMPGAFVWQLIDALLPADSELTDSDQDLAEASVSVVNLATSVQHFEKQNLKWEIFRRLPELIDRAEFQTLRAYVERLMSSTQSQDSRPTLFQLSELLADVFDGYQNSRPEWISVWDMGDLSMLSGGGLAQSIQDTQSWQAILWQSLYPETPVAERKHRTKQLELLQRALSVGVASGAADLLPDRIFVFGMSVIPPQWLPLFLSLGRSIDIHLLAQNPCRYYWGDLQSERQRLLVEKYRLEAGKPILGVQQEVVEGNALLASWGGLGKEYLGELYQFDQQDGLEELSFDLFEDYGKGEGALTSSSTELSDQELSRELLSSDSHLSALECVQSDILNLDQTQSLLAADDRSIRFARCHSRLREVEALKDYLLALLDEEPSLSVRDIIVMVPDIQDYTALVHAVFGMPVRASLMNTMQVDATTDANGEGGQSTRTFGKTFLPYGISDHSVSVDQPLLESLVLILNLSQSRVAVSEVFDFLDVAAVRAKLELSDSDVVYLQTLAEALNVRWGLSELHRDEHINTTHSGEANTWVHAFRRALLGYLSGDQGQVVEGVLSFELTSTEQHECLGKFIYFVDLIDETRNALSGELSVSEWVDALNRIWRLWFNFDELDEAVLRLMEQGLNSLEEQATVSGYSLSVPFTIVASVLTQLFEKEKVSQRFLAGRINFCTLMPMRTIPFKVVCLLGMNEADYPRRDLPQSFDLMTMLPRRRCDRSRREDDRYLFLEAVLSARQTLYLSHVGYAAKDNSERYPSVLVSELREYLAAHVSNIDGIEGEALLAMWTQEHRLQAFNRQYFADSRDSVGDNTAHASMKLPHSYASEWQSLFHEPWSDDTIRGDAQIITESIKQKHEQCPEPEQALQQETSSVASREFTLDALAAGHANPLAYYYQTSLGLSHWGTKDGVDDREPFTLNGLQAYSIKERLFEAWSIGDDLVGEDLNSDTLSADIEGVQNSGLDVVFEHLIAEGALARQPLAGMHFNALAQDASALRTHMFASGRPVRLRIQSMAVEGSDVHISGDLYYTGHGQIELSLSKRVGRNFFGVWLKHVVWNYYLHHTKPKLSALGETHYISATQHITLPALSEETSVIYLQELLTYYDEVLVAPKLFLPETAYVQLFGKESEIKTTFSGGFNQGGESALLFWQRACYFSGLNHDPSDIPDMENLVPMAQISRHCDPDHGSRKKKQPSDPAREPSELNRWISVEKLK